MIDGYRFATSRGHWARHNTPAGRGLTGATRARWIDVALFLLTFGTLLGYALAHGAAG